MSFEDHMEAISSALGTLHVLLACAFVPLVLMRRKEAPSTIAWILALIFLPGIGAVIFWFLGRDRFRRPARQKASDNLAVRDRLVAFGVDQTKSASFHQVLEAQQVPQRGVMQLAARVGRGDVVAGNAVDVFVGAKDAYAAHIAAIESAKDHIHVEFYIFEKDEQGQMFRSALVAAAKRGVRVRLLFDGFGSRRLTRKFLAPLREAGCHVHFFLPLDPIRRAWTINLRNHRKLMVVDGETGFAGGINVGNLFVPWRDVHLRVRGPAVRQLQAIFVEDWYFATRYDLADPAFFPDVPIVGESAVQFVGSGPDATVEAIHRVYFAAIASAREKVFLTTPYFVPDKALLTALQTAALRGVEVHLIVPRQSNHRVTFHAGRSYYEELLEAGVHVHEYLTGMVHTKTMIVDGEFATIGSANLDVRSFRLNFELIALLWDRDVVEKLNHIFEEDLRQTAQVELAVWRHRGLGFRVKEGIGRLCAPLL